MAEGDESWGMVVLGADVGGVTPNFASFANSFLTELNHPGPSTVPMDTRIYSAYSQSDYRRRGAHVWPDARSTSPRSAIDQDEAQTSVKGGVFLL